MINWNPLTSGLNFTNDNDSRMLIGDVGVGSGITQVNASSYLNQIIAEIRRKLGAVASYATVNTRITQSYILGLRTLANQTRTNFGKTAFNFTEDLTTRNLHNILVELRQALNSPRHSVAPSTTFRMIRELPYNGTITEFLQGPLVDFGLRAGKVFGNDDSTKRYRILNNFNLNTGNDVILRLFVTDIEIGLETFSLNIILGASDFDTGSVVASIPYTDFVEGQTYELNLGNVSTNLSVLLATNNEWSGGGADAGLNDASSGLLRNDASGGVAASVYEDEF